MKLYEDYVICSNDRFGAIYNIPQSKLITVDTNTAIEIKSQFEENKITEKTIEFLDANFENNTLKKNIYLDDFIKDRKFKKVQFIVTTNCNLNCVYCYANGGSYKRKIENMSFEVVDKIIESLIKYSDEIEAVQFFGGEPLIAYKTIMRICDRIKEKFNKIPAFSMVSNFTILPLEFIEYIRTYNIQITVSLDGPAEVNDKLRVGNKDCKTSTFEIVNNNINKLRSYGLDINAIECTYTDTHEKLGYSKSFLYEYFKKEFKIEKIIMGDEENFEIEQPILEFNDENFFTNYSAESLYNSISLMRSLFDKKLSKYHCGVGFTTLSFTPNGDIYPCHRFFSNKKYYMGNVFEKNMFLNEEFSNILAELSTINNKNNNKCKSCKARNICSQCPASILTVGKYDFDIRYCEKYNLLIEDVILKFIDFYNKDYKNFMSELKKSNMRYELK